MTLPAWSRPVCLALAVLALGLGAAPGQAGIRTEGSYTIDLTMQPDPVEDNAEAAFRLRVTLDDGADASADFSRLCLMIGAANLQPCLARDAETGLFTGSYRIAKPAGAQAGDSQPVTVYFWRASSGDSTAPPGEWGVHNSAADPDQKRWRLRYSNPFYFDASPPRDWSADWPFALLFAALGAALSALVLVLVLRRRRP